MRLKKLRPFTIKLLITAIRLLLHFEGLSYQASHIHRSRSRTLRFWARALPENDNASLYPKVYEYVPIYTEVSLGILIVDSAVRPVLFDFARIDNGFVIPVVVGSNPIGRPKIFKKMPRVCGAFFLLRNWDRGSAIRFFENKVTRSRACWRSVSRRLAHRV